MQVSIPRPSTSTLMKAERVDVVLVPLDDGAVRHGRVLDRDELVQGRLREHEPAGVLAQVPRKALERLRKVDQVLRGDVGRIELLGGEFVAIDRAALPPVDALGEPVDGVGAEAKYFAHLAHGSCGRGR